MYAILALSMSVVRVTIEGVISCFKIAIIQSQLFIISQLSRFQMITSERNLETTNNNYDVQSNRIKVKIVFSMDKLKSFKMVFFLLSPIS